MSTSSHDFYELVGLIFSNAHISQYLYVMYFDDAWVSRVHNIKCPIRLFYSRRRFMGNVAGIRDVCATKVKVVRFDRSYTKRNAFGPTGKYHNVFGAPSP